MVAKQEAAKSQIELADIIWNVRNFKYSLDDMIFRLVCDYLHVFNKEAKEESQIALKN